MQGVFIVGTGRSGTHFTARSLNGFSHANDPMGGYENSKILMDIAEAAIHHRLPSEETANYYRDLLARKDGVLIDQHHPNLFFVKHWRSKFDGLVFLYPQRPTYQIVASMFRHSGVMGWYRYARRLRVRMFDPLPYPNQFLGIDKFSEIRTLPKHLPCARRVIAHRRAFNALVDEMDGALRAINYEELVNDPFGEFSRVFTEDELAALGSFSVVEEPRSVSLTKFKDVLSEEQVEEIKELERQMLPQ